MLPLAGIRIVEMGLHLPGEYCTQILGDLGAEVIRVDPANPRSRPGEPEPTGLDPRYQTLNRNKQSIALDLKHPEAQRILHRLVERADVFMEGNRPGVAERLGADYATLSRINPRLIYCSITGYGQDGPYRMLPGHDINYIALSGILDLTGLRDGPPIVPGINVADLGGGTMFAAIGVLTALVARQQTGRGQYVDVSMLDGLLSWMGAVHAPTYLLQSQLPQRGATALTGLRPSYYVYETLDGRYLALGILEPWFWEHLCRALGREDLIEPMYPASAEEREARIRELQSIFRTKTRDEWFRILQEADTEVAPVYRLDEVFSDPQVQHRNLVVEVEHPGAGVTKQVGVPIKFSETPGAIRSGAPLIGQHTEEILLSLGYSPRRIEELRQAKAIK